MAYKITWVKNGIINTYTGVISFQEIIDANIAFYNDPRSDSAKYRFFDFSNTDKLMLTEKDIQYLAAMDLGASHSIKNLKTALIAKKPSIVSNLENYRDQSIAINTTWIFQVFSDKEHIQNWASN